MKTKLFKYWKKIRLPLLFAATFFLIMLLAMLLVFSGVFILSRLGLPRGKPEGLPLLMFALVSLFLGTLLAAVLSRRPLAPIRKIMEASDQIAKGNYNTRIHLRGPDEFKQLNNSFNHMAEELASVEMLRSDFVNNFSHEFKTPIVSIRGFAKMLKREDLTADEKNEYLDIIITESERLTELATNVLNLSKIEQQSILTDKSSYNVSEQIRLVIALLDKKWSDKHIEIIFDCEEISLSANEELLKQVWINLLDNAIKFSPEYGTVEIKIIRDEGHIIFTISDQGDGIPAETARHIFDKFFQGDISHSAAGNGIGLTIARHIIELHNGSISLDTSIRIGAKFVISIPGSPG